MEDAMRGKDPMEERLAAWMLRMAELDREGRDVEMDIHLDQLDRELANPGRWEEAIRDCLRTAEAVRAEASMALQVAVGFPLARPTGLDELRAPVLPCLIEMRTLTPPQIVLFRRGDEPWEVAVRLFEGRYARTNAGELELYLCEWPRDDEDEPRQGYAWIRAR
jgi:hypothetical protein